MHPQPSSISQDAINSVDMFPTCSELSELLDDDEIWHSIQKMSNDKALGSDGIPAEVFKYDGPLLLHRLGEIIRQCWTNEAVPQEFKDANIIHLYKRKGDRTDCNNHRGISLLSIAGKIMARVILDRLVPAIAEKVLPESQCGFRAGRGTIDMIFSALQLQEKSKEHHMSLYTVFINLTKAFDSVDREGFWKILRRYGCP